MIYFCHICLSCRHFTTQGSLFDPDNTDLLSHKQCLTDSLSLSVHFVHVFHFIIRLCLSSYGCYFPHSSLNSLPQREEYCTNSTIIRFCIESNLNGKMAYICVYVTSSEIRMMQRCWDRHRWIAFQCYTRWVWLQLAVIILLKEVVLELWLVLLSTLHQVKVLLQVWGECIV